MKSPLRYPGGKAKLADFFESLILKNNLENFTYLEPYAGGCGLALELLNRGLVRHVTLNDADTIIYNFWVSILDNTDEFCELIKNTKVSLETWQIQKRIIDNPEHYSSLEQGFATFFLNRTNRSGIIKGAGVIGGYAQAGDWKIDARYYRDTMVNRVEAIGKKKSSIKIYNKDALEFCKFHVREKNNLTYLDPPYFEKGHRLYRNFYNPEDHAEIAEFVQNNLRGRWVVSYDNAPEIMTLYEEANSFIYNLAYTATKRREGTEAIFFSKDLIVPEPCKPMLAAA